MDETIENINRDEWTPKEYGLFPCLHAAWFFFVAAELRKRGSKMKVEEILKDNHYVELGNEMGINYDVMKNVMRQELEWLDFFDKCQEKNKDYQWKE